MDKETEMLQQQQQEDLMKGTEMQQQEQTAPVKGKEIPEEIPVKETEIPQQQAAQTTVTRRTMDYDLVKAASQSNGKDFSKLVVSKLGPSRVEDAEKGPADPESMKFLQGVTSTGDGVLHIAARFGDDRLVRLILERLGVMLPAAGKGNNACAAAGSNDELFEIASALLMARNAKGETCLHEAVRHGHKQVVKSLRMADAILHPPASAGTRDAASSSAGPPALVRVLDSTGASPLYLATTLRRVGIVRMLLAPGPSEQHQQMDCNRASYEGPRGETALHAAVLLSKELSKQLVRWDRDLTGRIDDSGSTPLHFVASSGAAKIAEVLLRKDPNDKKQKQQQNDQQQQEEEDSYYTRQMVQDSNGQRPIHVAAAHGSRDVIRRICKACPECIPSLNSSGQTFLHVAVENARLGVVQYVCDDQRMAGILNARDRDGNTALHLAVKAGNQFIFCTLMRDCRVSLSFANNQGRTPLDLAISSIQPGLTLLQNSRVLIYYHLWLARADFGARRRDAKIASDDKETAAAAQPAGDAAKEKVSETMTKTAGIMAVCAIFMLNIAVTAFFNVDKLDSPSSTALAPDYQQSAGKTLLAVPISVTFGASAMAAFCSTFAGLSVMERHTRLAYLRAAGIALHIASWAVVAVFVLAAYLAFSPVVDPSITIAAVALPVLAVLPQIAPYLAVILHVRALLHRLNPLQRVGLVILTLIGTISPLIIVYKAAHAVADMAAYTH